MADREEFLDLLVGAPGLKPRPLPCELMRSEVHDSQRRGCVLHDARVVRDRVGPHRQGVCHYEPVVGAVFERFLARYDRRHVDADLRWL